MGFKLRLAEIPPSFLIQFQPYCSILIFKLLEEIFYHVDSKEKIFSAGKVEYFDVLSLHITPIAIYGHLIYEENEVEWTPVFLLNYFVYCVAS